MKIIDKLQGITYYYFYFIYGLDNKEETEKPVSLY